MTVHTCEPGHPGILADDCERCDQHAKDPMLLSFDQEKMAAMWDKMIDVERNPDGGSYATDNEAKAGRQLYLLAIWLERYVGGNPWRPFAQVRSGYP